MRRHWHLNWSRTVLFSTMNSRNRTEVKVCYFATKFKNKLVLRGTRETPFQAWKSGKHPMGRVRAYEATLGDLPDEVKTQ